MWKTRGQHGFAITLYQGDPRPGPFPLTLERHARKWYKGLKLKTIGNFPELCEVFVSEFRGAALTNKNMISLLLYK